MDPQLPRPSDVISPNGGPGSNGPNQSDNPAPQVPRLPSLQPADTSNPLPQPVATSSSSPPLMDRDTPIKAPRRFRWRWILIPLLILLAAGGGYVGYKYLPKTNHQDHEQHNANTQPDPVIETVPAKTCLVKDDYVAIDKAIFGPNDGTRELAVENQNFASSLLFNTNTTDFVAPQSSGESIVSAYAEFAKTKQASRQFKITIMGLYNGANIRQSDIDLANKRAEKIKTMLVTGGANEEILEVMDAASTGPTVTEGTTQLAQEVFLEIDRTCTTN